MQLDSVFDQLTTKWVADKGPHSDVVLTSRVRLARNLRAYPFPHLMKQEHFQALLKQLQKSLVDDDKGSATGGKLHFLPLPEVGPLDRQVLVEKHLISPNLASAKHAGTAVLLREDEAVSIMVNEEDHLRVQCLLPGFQLDECWKIANEVDNYLEGRVDYAFHQERGYLTACPTNVGTGMRASVMVHLPGLVITQQIGRVLAAISQVGLVVRGLYGEGTEAAGNMFQISNQITLGPSEEEILHNLNAVIKQIIEQERASRQSLVKARKVFLEDRIFRSYGILTNARLLQSQEAMRLLSDVRLGVELGIITDLSPHVLNELLILMQPAIIQRQSEARLSESMRDQRRADIVRKRLSKQG